MAITHANYIVHLLMLDMSKAFDTVNRKTLFVILSEILGQDELHIFKLLTEDVKLQVKIEEELGEEILMTKECHKVIACPHSFSSYISHML